LFVFSQKLSSIKIKKIDVFLTCLVLFLFNNSKNVIQIWDCKVKNNFLSLANFLAFLFTKSTPARTHFQTVKELLFFKSGCKDRDFILTSKIKVKNLFKTAMNSPRFLRGCKHNTSFFRIQLYLKKS